MSNSSHASVMQSHSAVLDGQTLAYLKAGNGPAVVIIHGLGGHKEDFHEVIARLAEHFTVYAPDMLGFGGSSRNAPLVGPGAQAAAVKALLAHEGVHSAYLAGNSAGGWVAATFAARYPEATRKLALIDPAGLKVTLSGPPPISLIPQTVAEMQALLKATIAAPFAQSDAFAEQSLVRFEASGEAASLKKLFADFVTPTNTDETLDDVLPKVQVPTLVVWGELDGLFPAALADIVVAQSRNARKLVIPGASHFVQIDAPDALADALTAFFD
jgi:triacylglycerol lipase